MNGEFYWQTRNEGIACVSDMGPWHCIHTITMLCMHPRVRDRIMELSLNALAYASSAADSASMAAEDESNGLSAAYYDPLAHPDLIWEFALDAWPIINAMNLQAYRFGFNARKEMRRIFGERRARAIERRRAWRSN